MDYREMRQLAQDPERIRGIARMLIKLSGDDIGEKAQSFLSDLEKYDGTKPLSTRQLEALSNLRERSTRASTAGRYKAARLVEQVYQLRFDLDDFDTEDWISSRRAEGPDLALSSAEWRKVIALCKDLDIISREEWVELP